MPDEITIDRIAKEEEEISLNQAIEEFIALMPFASLPEAYKAKHILKRYEARKMSDQIQLNIVRPGSSLPMLCRGPSCHIKHQCAFNNAEGGAVTFPIGAPCPVEASLIEFWRNDYYRTLNIDRSDKVERDRTEELVELDLTVWRINTVIAANGYTVDNAVGVSNTGAPLFKKELNPLLEAKDKASRRKDKILNEFISTRDSRERSAVRRAKIQSMQNTGDWFKILRDKAAAAGIDSGSFKSPVEIAMEKVEATKQIEQAAAKNG
jgi:hypothetical protein